MSDLILIGLIAIAVLLVGAMVFFGGLAFVAWLVTNRDLAKRGVVADAEVISRRTGSVHAGRNSGVQYFITYRYYVKTADGKKTEYSREENVWESVYDKYPEGSHFNVRYSPGDPTIVMRSSTLIGLNT